MRLGKTWMRAALLAGLGCAALLGCSKGDETGDVRGGEQEPVKPGDPITPDAGNLFGEQPTVPTQTGDAGPTAPTGPETGTCGASCFETPTGADTNTPFDLDDNPSDNVGLDDDGALVLRAPEGAGSNYIWIANTGEGTVSKINVENYEEEARYRVATGEMAPDGNEYGSDPSRTSVNLEGDAFVGSRTGHGLTRISVQGEDCPDTNGDGDITTSTGPDDVLDYGDDDCVLWFTELEGTVRGVAAQDIPGTTEVDVQPDEEPVITTTDAEHYVWVGNTEEQLWKIDAETGEILIATKAPTMVYGLAMTGNGILYTTGGYYETSLGWVDTSKCVDEKSCDDDPCVATCIPGDCDAPDECANETMVDVDIDTDTDTALADEGKVYGITVDCKQRVWLGAANENQPVRRFDPTLDDADRMAYAAAESGGVHGIGADRNGFVWGAQPNSGMVRVDGDTLEAEKIMLDAPAKGIGIDRLGKIWGISQGAMTQVIEPGGDLDENPVVGMVDGLVNPYTYSDMTGEQLRLATNEPGHYRTVFEGCGGDAGGADGPTMWGDLEWDVETPDGTYVVFMARTADTVKDLEDADWFTLTALPGPTAALPLDDLASGADVDLQHYIEVEVRLITNDVGSAGDRCGDGTDAVTPRVKSFVLTYRCKTEVG
jgi:hypothetical protein